MGEIGLFPADPVEPDVPGKGLFRLGVLGIVSKALLRTHSQNRPLWG